MLPECCRRFSYRKWRAVDIDACPSRAHGATNIRHIVELGNQAAMSDLRLSECFRYSQYWSGGDARIIE